MTAHILKCPTGRFTLVGRVPRALAWEREDGQPMTDKDWHTVEYCMAPGSFGYKHPTWSTEQEAAAALAKVQS
jgi:hypothetical protein